MDKCEMCESEEFISEGGFYFCSSCGTQSQQQKEAIFISEEIEPSQVALPSLVKEKESIETEEEKLSILDKFQRILLMQCDALIGLGCDRSVKEAIKRLWFRYLHYSGYAFETVKLKPLSQTMHDGLPKKILRFKKNRRVCSTSVPGPIPLISVDTSESRAPKRQLSPSFDPDPSSLTSEVTVSQYLSNPESLGESESKISTPLRKKPRKQKPKASENVSEKEASSRELDVKREIVETGGNIQEDDVEQMHLSIDSSQEEIISEFIQNSTPELFEQEKAYKTKPSSLEQSLSQFPDIASFFDDSSSRGEDETDDPSGAEKTTEEVDEYYMSLKKQFSSSHMKVLSLKHTLAICYLGLLYTQQNILLTDFARWVDINKLPYYNVLGLLPESCRKGKLANMFRPKARDVSADNLYVFLRYFCWYLPLPPLPTMNATTMCQILIGKLHLPEHFNKIVEKFLRCIEKPKFDGAFVHTHRTFDIQCMAVIVYLLRMIYSLNDIIEFDMEELVRQEEDPNQSEEYIYLWEDWIALYSKIKINDLSKSIPTCKSELPFLTSPKNFVDYCFDMFNLSIRSNPTDIDPETNKPVDPNDHTELIDALKRAQAKVEKWSEKEPSNVQLKLPTPRRIYLSDLRSSRYSAWHQCDELQRDIKKNRFHDIELSHSFRFLLQTCCEILNVPATELYEKVCTVDSQVTHASMALKKFYATIPKPRKKNVEPRKEQQSQQTQTEDALFPFLSVPPDDKSTARDDHSSRIPVRSWMFVPENTNPEICVPEFRRKYEKKVQTGNEKMYPRLSLLSDCGTPNNESNRALLQERLNSSTADVPPDDTSVESSSNNSDNSLIVGTNSDGSDTLVMETDSISSSVSD